jgi:polygalacturonase
MRAPAPVAALSSGRRFTGPASKSRVNLHVAKGATLAFSQDPKTTSQPVHAVRGAKLANYSPFIYALDQQDIAITGEGTLDGQSDNTHWWP